MTLAEAGRFQVSRRRFTSVTSAHRREIGQSVVRQVSQRLELNVAQAVREVRLRRRVMRQELTVR